MRFGYLTESQITYNRRVLKGIAQFGKLCGSLQLRVLNIARPQDINGLDAGEYDGLLMGTSLANCQEARCLRVPVVNISNTYLNLPFPQVVPDDREVGRVVAKHMLARGYRHFAFFGWPTGWAQQRWEGFSSTIVDVLGVDFTPARAGTGRLRPSKQWLRDLPRPLGLMASNDPSALDFMELCHECGLRVPEDVAVVGVDDDELYAEFTNPPLSSVSQQYDRIGYLAADHLMRLVLGETIPKVTLIPPGPLMARQSSNAVAVSDELVVQAIQLMLENLPKRPDISELANTIGVSRRSLEVRFKAALGRTPHQELSRLRIERAQYLLATTTLSLKQIAVMSGFGNAIRLSDGFRDFTDQTPTGYRRQFTLNAVVPM